MMTSSIKLFPHPCFVYAAQYHPGSPHIIVTGGYDHYLRVWTKLSEGLNGKVRFCRDNLVLTLKAINSSHVAATLTVMSHCFLRPLRKHLTSSSYMTINSDATDCS